ncbi:MAG: hypothetical protein AAGJ97_00505 [Planctomycetota bacterium]
MSLAQPTPRLRVDVAASTLLPRLIPTLFDESAETAPRTERDHAAAGLVEAVASRLDTARPAHVAIDVAHVDLVLRVLAARATAGGAAVSEAIDPCVGPFAACRRRFLTMTDSLPVSTAAAADRVRRLGERFADALLGLAVGHPGTDRAAAAAYGYAHDPHAAAEYGLESDGGADRAAVAALSAGSAMGFARQEARARWRPGQRTAEATAAFYRAHGVPLSAAESLPCR